MLQMSLDGVVLQPHDSARHAHRRICSSKSSTPRKSPARAKVEQHMVLLEPSADQLAVSETFFYRNDGKTTYNDPAAGTLHLFLPDAAEGKVRSGTRLRAACRRADCGKDQTEDCIRSTFRSSPARRVLMPPIRFRLPIPAIFRQDAGRRRGDAAGCAERRDDQR